MKAVLLMVLVLCVAGCGEQSPEKVVPKAADHNYVMQDGMKYGYPAALSENARKAGQQAESLVMALYAGERDGKHQAHIRDGMTVTAMECSVPCNYIKIMTFIDSDYLRDHVKVETLTATPGTIAYSIMQDAINGRLKQYGLVINGKTYTVWVDEQQGLRKFPKPSN